MYRARNTYSRKRDRSSSVVRPRKKTNVLKGKKGIVSQYSPGITQIIRGKDFLPQKLQTRFNYTQKIAFTASTTPQTYVWRGNSMFDPDQTGTGGQPIGYDQMAFFYTFCEVYSSKVSVVISNRSTSPVELIIVPSQSTTETINFDTSGTMPKAKKIYVDSANSGGAIKILTNYCTTFDMLGIKRDSGADVRATFASNPAQQYYWLTHVVSVDGASPLNLTYDFTITYEALLTGRKNVALS